MATSNERGEEETRYSVDIRMLLAVITVTMAVAFTLGVVIPSHKTKKVEPPEGTTTDLHEPAGQHLLVDIKGIEADFLDSEKRLVQAMSDTVEATGLTMLSYHCHSLLPKGVSCIGVLLESHIYFHTWPDNGVISVDLFTCGTKSLLPAVETVKKMFGIGDNIFVNWSHELRGFRNKLNANNTMVIDHNSDISRIFWGPFEDLKEQIVSVSSNYQRIDVWELIGKEETPSHEDGIKAGLKEGDPRWLNNKANAPERYLFLDGALQIINIEEIPYHEAMVHPGMFAHPNPRHVAIVGGGDGAPLREVLKHSTVQSVTMVEIDEDVVDIAKKYFPRSSDCSDLVGRANSCFDDHLVTLVFEDAKQWFVDRYGATPTKKAPVHAFDVVIVDALDPEGANSLSRGLYENLEVVTSLIRSLTKQGILAINFGRSPTILDPRPDIGVNSHREVLLNILESLPEVEAVFVYDDPDTIFDYPSSFLVVCKDASCRKHFYASPDVLNFHIYERIVQTHSKKRALSYFDGVTHLSYQVAPKSWETIYCRRNPIPFECVYRQLDITKGVFEFNAEIEDAGSFKITSDYDEGGKIKKTHVLATVDIPKGSYIMPEHVASSMVLSEDAILNLRGGDLQDDRVDVIEDFVEFIDNFGHLSTSAGSARTLIEVGASSLIRRVETEEEANVGRWIPPHPAGKRPTYSPVYERFRLSFDVFIVATKDIPKGTELLKYSHMWDKE